MKRWISMGGALVLLAGQVQAAPNIKLKVASLLDTQMAAYIDIELSERNGQLVLVRGSGFSANNFDKSVVVNNLECKASPENLRDFQQSSTIPGVQSISFAIDCQPEEGGGLSGVFVLAEGLANRNPAWQNPRQQPQCGKTAPLGTPVRLLMGSQQSYCFEEWDSITDPKSQLGRLLQR